MAKAIDIIIENCKNEYYGLTSSCPTGPSVLGRAQSQLGTNNNQIIGFFMPLTYQFKQKNRSYILPTGDIFAVHKDTWLRNATGGDISIVKAINDMYWTQDGTDATRTLGTRGMATLLFTSSSQCYISGSPLS